MIIAMCCTRNWYIYLITVLSAIFKNNEVKKVYLFIEDDKIGYIKDKRVKFINVNSLKEYIIPGSPNYSTSYTKMSFMRCCFSKYLTEDKVLYLDVDTIVNSDISSLWNTPFEDSVLVGVKEGGDWNNHLSTYGLNGNYINSGVLLMNLKAIREEKLDDSMIELLNKNKYAYPDQDVINLVCRNRIKYVGSEFNSCETTGIVENAKIIHYIRGNKGWMKTSPRSEIWYKYYKEAIGGKGMEIYKVKTIKSFNDYEGKEITANETFKKRRVGELFECTKERGEFLLQNKVVELVELIPVIEEEPKEVKEEAKEVKEPKETKKKGKKVK